MVFDADLEAELLTQDFQHMYVQWGNSSSPRTGIHASAVLVPEKEWCLRELVLLNLYGDQAEQGVWQSWDWKRGSVFENGWEVHRKWQTMFKKFANVVWTPESDSGIAFIPSNELARIGKEIDGKMCVPELDLTHYDSDRNLYFSPDAIIRFGGEKYIVEIKGIKQESYVELTDDLEQACQSCETVHKAREQANLYCHLTGIKRGIILVENKNNQNFKLWVIEYEAERAYPYTNRLNDIKGRTALVKAHGASKLPLPCCKSSSDTRARKCPMRTKCFQLQESEEW